MFITVAILVWLALGLCVGLYIWRDSILGLDKAPPLTMWAAVAIVGVPLLCLAMVLRALDFIIDRR